MSNLRTLKDMAKADKLQPHEWLACRAVAWLVGRGFRLAATEVPIGREDVDYDGKAELADAAGVGIVEGWARCCVVEVKVSRADFLADFKKEHRQADFGDGVTDRFYFMPKGMAIPQEVPDPWGLAEWDPELNKVTVAKRARSRRLARRPDGAPYVSNLAPPWEYALEDHLAGGRNAWVRSWWQVVSRIVNAYEFGYLAIGKKRSAGGYYFGTPTSAGAVAAALGVGESAPRARPLETDGDAYQARDVAVKTWGEFVFPAGVEGLGHDYWDRAMARQERGETRILVADVPRGVAAFAEVSVPKPGAAMEVAHLAVSDWARREGLGTLLLAEAALMSESLGVPLAAWTWGTNKAALALFESLGFQEVERRPDDRGPGVDSVRLVRTPFPQG